MWSPPRARPADWRSSTTPSRRSAAPRRWCRWRCATIAGIERLAGALNERYGKLDILVGNAALGASNSPLDHFEPKEWEEVLAVNVTANWHLIRNMHALLLRSDAGRVVFITSGAAANPRAYRGLYATYQGRARNDGADLCQRDAVDADQGQHASRRARRGRGCARRSLRAKIR